MSEPKGKEQHNVLLFDEDDGEGATNDPQLEEKISKYLQERVSKMSSSKNTRTTAEQEKPAAKEQEEHTGITDDEADEEGEPDYDVASRMTMKASSEAFLEVMAEARQQFEKEKEAARSKKQGKEAPKKP